MRRLISSASALVLAFAAVVGAGCKGRAPSPLASAEADSGTIPPAEAAQVLARVGDRVITLGDFAAAIDHMDEFDRIRYRSPQRRKELLREMIDIMLLADEARDKGYDKDPIAEEEIRQILRDAVRKKARSQGPAPADIPVDEVRAYYAAHAADFRDPERRRVSAIVLPGPLSQAAATSVVDAARGGDAAWGELVRTRSLDAHAKADVPADLAGDLGFVSPPGDIRGANARVPEEVRVAAFNIPHVGEVFPRVVRVPMPAEDGGPGSERVYVVKLAGIADAHVRSFQDVERSLRVRVAQEKAAARENALLEDLRTKYPVTIDESALNAVRLDSGKD